ncbi:hypothetical protein BKA66DRAFT_452368 [Pyrenochaeta sp. MPI-SDFR-AT-0127]|nr:hypothetical protein BKA66DRAFT_452368 [Pyrenochaeta sp. MPI-SDFR-AT-0127]
MRSLSNIEMPPCYSTASVLCSCGGFLFGRVSVCTIWMPETKGKSLDEIEIAFSRKTPKFRPLFKFTKEG